MLVREIIDRVRNDLDDNRTVEYTDIDLMDRIRMELNDRAETGTPIDVLNEVRKILGDAGTRTGVPVSLASIRGELNDTADVTPISQANLLAYLRELLGDDSNRTGEEVSLASIRGELNDTADVTPISPANLLAYLRELLGDDSARTGTAVSLASIRAELNDTANVTAATQEDITNVSNSVLSKMGKASDTQIGTTTEANVSVDSVIHYAQWGNIGNVTGTNGNVNSSVVIANSSNLLSTYAADGIKTIKGMRPDGLVGDDLNGGFQAALNLYVLARCLEGEVETNAGNGGYRTFHEQFEKAVAAVPAYVQDAAIANFISLGTVTITARRPDLGAAICKSTLSVLENFVMAQVSQTKQGGELQANLTTFYSDLDKIPYHYVDAELNQFIADGQNAVRSLRPDAATDINLFSEAVKSYVICHAMGRRFGKSAEAMSLWQAHDANFKSSVAAVPYHWTDEELNNFITIVSTDIRGRRPDLGVCNGVLSLLLNFAAAHAQQQKPGNAVNLSAEEQHFYAELDRIPYHYVDAELNQYIADGKNAIKSLRPDAASEINIFSDAVKSYVVCHALGRRFGKSAEAMSLWQAHDANFKSSVAAVPYHWTDAELNNFITIVSTDIRGRRPDLGVCNGVLSLLLNFAAAHAQQQKPGNAINLSVEEQHFYAELDKIPYHYVDAELNQYIADGQNAIKAIRQDAGGMIDCFSDAVKSYAVCHALGRRFGKAAETMSLWQAHDANFKAGTTAVPYHWTDAELAALSETGRDVIAVKRPDLSGTGAESVGRMHYTVFSALERRIGTDSNAAALHKVHYEQFYSDLETVPYHWTDEELTNFQNEAIQTISSLRDDMTDGLKIRSDLVPAVLFCVSSLANNIRKDAASRNLSDAQWTKLVNLTKGLPYHWTDGELLNQVHDSIRDILTKRSDARMDDMGYELNGIETEPLIGDEYPLRESFAKASEWFSAAGAIASRIGTDAGADAKYQMWMGRYNEQIMGSTNRRS